MAFGTPEDDETPKYDPLAALLAGYNQNAPQQDQQPQQPAAQAQPPIPYLPQDQQAGNQSASAPPQAQPQQAQTQQPSVALASAPPSPAVDEQKYQALQAEVAKYGKPTDRNDKAVAPKWWERLAGAGVGFGAAFNGDVAGGIRAGSDVTNRAYDKAESARQGNEQAAQQNLGDYERQIDLANRQYGVGLEGQRVSQESARFNKSASDSDRNFGKSVADTAYDQNRNTMNDTRGQQNTEADRQQRSDFHTDDLAFEGKRLNESSRHDRATEGYDSQRVGFEGKRVNIEQQKADQDKSDTSPKTALLKLRANIDASHDDALNKLEYGDPKATSDEERNGFKATRAALARSSKDPLTNKPWANPADRDAAVQSMDEQQAQHKNGIEASRSQQLGRAGIQQPAIQYDAKGNAVNGGPTQQQQAPPPSQAPKAQVSIQKAMSMPQYKGRTSQQVQQEIESHGYKAIP